MTQQNPVRQKSSYGNNVDQLEILKNLESQNSFQEDQLEILKNLEAEESSAPPAPDGGYEVPQVSEPGLPSTQDPKRKLAVMAKEGAAEAAGGLVDLAALPWNLAAPVIEWMKNNEVTVPRVPSAVEGVSHAIDNATDGYTTTLPEDKVRAAAVRGAVGVLAPGGIGKMALKHGAKGLGKALSWVGSTNPGAAVGGALAASSLEAQHQAGDDSLGAAAKAMGLGVVSDAILSSAFAGKAALKRGVQSLDRTVKRATGFGPDNLNLEAYDAAKAAGIVPRNAAISKSQDVATAEKVLGNLPWIGQSVKGSIAENDKTATRFLEDTFDRVGPRRTAEIGAEIKRLYSHADSLANPEEMLTSDLLAKAVSEAKSLLPRKSVKGDSVKTASATIRDIEKDFLSHNPSGKITINGSEVDLNALAPEARESLLRSLGEQGQYVNMRDARDLKENLGEIISKVETMVGATPSRDSGPGKGLAALIKIRDSVGETMKTSKSKEYLEALKEADTFYASIKRRETLDRILGSVSGMEISPGVNSVLDYNQILKRSTSPENKEALKKAFGDAYYKKFQNFLKYTDSVSSLSDPRRRNANPSASGIVMLASKLLMSGRFTLASTLYLPCLTSEKFLDTAVRYARNPTEKTAGALVNTVKDVTGYSAYQLRRALVGRESFKEKKNENTEVVQQPVQDDAKPFARKEK